MWVQTQQPDRPGAVLPQLSVPSATPLRAAGAAFGTAADPTTSAGEPSTASTTSTTAPQPGQVPSVPGSEGTFLLVDDPPAAGIRDSFASIVDDPFFLRFDAPDATSALSSLTTSADHRHDERQPWIPPRKESLNDTSPTPWVGSVSREEHLAG